MIGIIDVYYKNNWANAALIGFDNWENEQVLLRKNKLTPIQNNYIPGEFYKKELPPIISLLDDFELSIFDLFIIDGYVYLDDQMKAGMGHYLWNALDNHFPIIGVAKNKFETIEKLSKPIFRGKSQKPLFVTSADIELQLAATLIKEMGGPYRIPNLLKEVDQLSRVI